jgi:hypothetical protein
VQPALGSILRADGGPRVRSGSIASFSPRQRHVRFSPEIHRESRRGGPAASGFGDVLGGKIDAAIERMADVLAKL